jgi:nitrile hydratase accessory protein
MDQVVDRVVSNMPADVALPRKNGELVFETPWEARAFGLAVALHEKGAFEWKLFSQTLAEEITAAESTGESSTYYERWLKALNRVTTGQDLLAAEEIADRSERVRLEDDYEHHHEHHHRR